MMKESVENIDKEGSNNSLTIPPEIISLTNSIRVNQVKKIPKYKLQQENVSGGIIALDRNDLISRLPKGGTVAEIGVDEGDFTSKILEISDPEKLYLVDLWGSERYHDGKASQVYNKFKNLISQEKVEVIRSSSVAAAESFSNSLFDWIYLDTDHSYSLTIEELYAYAPKIKDNGLILGHDYTMGNWGKSYKYGVIEAIAEFCLKENWKISCITADFSESNSFAITRI